MFVLVMAKQPVPGRVKTRLCPPCTPSDAADIASAALADTFDAALASGADEVVVALDGEPGPWLPPGVRVIPQIDAGFDRRLAAAWDTMTGPGVQIGMDTPQVTAALLDDAMDRLTEPAHDAVLGRATDGGWWAIGFDASQSAMHGGRIGEHVFHDVPMSTPHTGAHQRRRLDRLGLGVCELPTLTDVDRFAEARDVARLVPYGRFADAVRRVDRDGVSDASEFDLPTATSMPTSAAAISR